MPIPMREITVVLIAVAVGIWSYFAFSLGPSLLTTNRPAFYRWMVAAAIYGWLVTQFLYSGWLGRPENATGVQAVAAAAQAVFAVALIVLTVRTVQANAKLVEETEKMAEVAVHQQQAATRPVLVFRIWSTAEDVRDPTADAFRIEVVNVGAGPALETSVSVDGPPLRYDVKSFPPQPAVVTLVDPILFEFRLDIAVPITDDSDPLRWTPDPDLEAQFADLASRVLTTTEERDAHKRLSDERLRRGNDYRRRVADCIVGLPNVGQVRAVYADLAGISHRSTVPILVLERRGDSPFAPNWPSLTLGRVTIETPVTATPRT